MAKKLLMLICIALFCATNIKAQYYYYNDNYYGSDVDIEFGVSTGIMNSLTDLGGKKGLGKGFIKDLNWKNTQAQAGLFFSGLYQNKIGLRLEATFGKVKGYDSILKGDNSVAKNRYNRNLSFRSPIFEISTLAEIHPMAFFNKVDDFGSEPSRFSPYLLAGVGLFTFNPQAYLNGVWINLEPLRLEGQGFGQYPERKRYKTTQINVPVGIGIKYELGALATARAEIVHRFLSTDYLDDVSTTYIDPSLFASNLTPTQAAIANLLHDRSLVTGTSNPNNIRGDAKDKDAFFTINFKLSIMLNRKRIH
jgi:hypothetical protein